MNSAILRGDVLASKTMRSGPASCSFCKV
jgi:hypothetical protein